MVLKFIANALAFTNEFFSDDLGANRVIEKADLWKYFKGLQQYFMDNCGIFIVY